jgi:KUP system potassium uptake protein
MELNKRLEQLNYDNLNFLPNMTAIFITDIYEKGGGSFLHFLKLAHAMPENILIVSYTVENIPRVAAEHRYDLTHLGKNVYSLVLHYGFMDFISIPTVLHIANEQGLFPFTIDVETTVYWVELPNIVASTNIKSLPFYWQEKLFVFLARNYSANLDIEFYHLPYTRSIAIGTYYLI